MNAPMLRTLSRVAAVAALVGLVLLVYGLATGGSPAGPSALVLIAIVLFFTFRHLLNKDGTDAGR
ncbi:hypothetical protein [Qipengyuania sp. MTN3-11]|uniref:hypothetical protein n=1 Tax=Qipengyuania sp. MTN3-11 TaxID=3056557 RepID=UPI0036F28230